MVAATYGREVVDLRLDGAVPYVHLTESNQGFLAEISVLCGGFTGVGVGLKVEGDLQLDGAQQDIGRIEEIAIELSSNVCNKGVDEAKKLAEFLNLTCLKHLSAYGPERYLILLDDVTSESLLIEGGIRERLIKLAIFTAKADAMARLSSPGGRKALYEAAQYLLETGTKSAQALNRRVRKRLSKGTDAADSL